MNQSKEELIKNVGKNIRKLREGKKLSIEALASHASIDYSQLIRIENGKINTSIYNAYTIANALGVTVCDLFD